MLKNAFKADTGVVITCRTSAMFKLIVIILSVLFTSCARPTHLGQQYLDGRFGKHVLHKVKKPKTDKPKDYAGFKEQLAQVQQSELGNAYEGLYTKVLAWHADGGVPENLPHYGITVEQIGGADRYGNVLITGYYSPVLTMSKQPTEKYMYPVHRKPDPEDADCDDKYPTRAEVYAGALQGKQLELGYSASLLDIFLMEVQGSGFVKFTDSDELVYFAYAGKNGHPYVSIGKVLIERNEIAKEDMSVQAIRAWAAQQDEATLMELLTQNSSYVFFAPQEKHDVLGTAKIPLLAYGAVAADREYLPMGSVLLAEVPQIDETGNWTGEHILNLLTVLDTGGAIKGNHIDLYCGIGELAGAHAGYLKHYGRVWCLHADAGS